MRQRCQIHIYWKVEFWQARLERQEGGADVQGREAERGTVEPEGRIWLAEVLAALSRALDLTEGQPYGHAVRTCCIGMRIAEQLKLGAEERAALFYALLLKDAGCSSNAATVAELFAADDRLAKRALAFHDWGGTVGAVAFGLRMAAYGKPLPERLLQILSLARAGLGAQRRLVAVRCERGAAIVRQLGFPDATAKAVEALDEHWDGRGHPLGLKGQEIPLLARIACLSQTLEVFHWAYGVEVAYRVVRARSGRWFDPELVRAAESFAADRPFWESMYDDVDPAVLRAYEPEGYALPATEERVDEVAEAFAGIIDAKSPYTFRHSSGVATIGVALGRQLGLPPRELRLLRHAGLLHDIGKLGVPNTVLDKAGPLSPSERVLIQQHPLFSEEILAKVSVFAPIAPLAGAHHERLDGQGYPRGLRLGELSTLAKLLPVADVFEALTADRPYRPALSVEEALALLEEGSGSAFWPEGVVALAAALQTGSLRYAAAGWQT